MIGISAFSRTEMRGGSHGRLFVSKFGPNAERLYNPVQEAMASQLLGRLFLRPDDFLDHLRL